MRTYIEQCICSVADQDVHLEHLVIDGNSTDGTQMILKNKIGLNWISENDKGMYDALNKGLSMAKGEIIGQLNADEQYLPGTLSYVLDFFDKHPHIDYIVGDFLVVDTNNELIAYRKSFKPFWPFFFSNYLYNYTCTLFYRKKVSKKLCYNSNLKSIADVDFFYKLQKLNFKGAYLRRFMATYMHTGKNLSILPFSRNEKSEYESNVLPFWFKIVKPFFKGLFHFLRLLNGSFWYKGNLEYSLFEKGVSKNRRVYINKKPTWRWVLTR